MIDFYYLQHLYFSLIDGLVFVAFGSGYFSISLSPFHNQIKYSPISALLSSTSSSTEMASAFFEQSQLFLILFRSKVTTVRCLKAGDLRGFPGNFSGSLANRSHPTWRLAHNWWTLLLPKRFKFDTLDPTLTAPTVRLNKDNII